MFGLGKKKGPQEVSLNSGEYSFEVEPDPVSYTHLTLPTNGRV